MFGQSELRREQPLQQQLSAVSAAGCCAPPMVNTKRLGHVKTSKVGHRQDYFFIPLREQLSKKNIVLQNIIPCCTCKPTFSYVMRVIHSWHPSAMNGPVA